MKNLATIISSHNLEVLKPSVNVCGCNCRDRNICLLDNNCKQPQIVYQMYVSNNLDNESKYYYGFTETLLKERYGNQKSSFRHERSRNATEPSKYV